MDRLRLLDDRIMNSIPNANRYLYDGTSDSISDGGGDMYDNGNVVCDYDIIIYFLQPFGNGIVL